MKINSLGKKFVVENFDFETKDSLKKHGPLFPNTIRALICGGSNCGKTNLLLSLLTHPNGLRFKNVYIYSKSLNQPKYQLLERIMKGLPQIGYFTYTENVDVLPPSKVKPFSIMIFDDIPHSNLKNVKEYFSRGRHYSCDSIYLAQSYSAVFKHLIRDNSNFIVLFKMDDLNLRHVYNDFVNTDFSYEKFKQICHKAWKDKYSFLVIDKDSDVEHGRYRFGLDRFFSDIV